MNARQKAAKNKYMREYMRKYYKKHAKKILAQGKITRRLRILKKKLKAKKAHSTTVVHPSDTRKVAGSTPAAPTPPERPIKRPPPVYIIDPEPPTCPSCGTLRQWLLSCPVCNRDHPHKPPSPKQSRVHIIEDGQPVDGESD